MVRPSSRVVVLVSVGVATVLVLALGLAVGGHVRAQDGATPPAAGGPGAGLCATPLAGAEGTPVAVATASDAAATPGGVDPGMLVGLFPCATPDAATPGAATPGAEP